MVILKVLNILVVVAKTARAFIEDKLDLAFVTSTSELETSLKNLEVDITNLKCVCCNSTITGLDDVRGVYKKKDFVFAYCNKPKCELTATHVMLD